MLLINILKHGATLYGFYKLNSAGKHLFKIIIKDIKIMSLTLFLSIAFPYFERTSFVSVEVLFNVEFVTREKANVVFRKLPELQQNLKVLSGTIDSIQNSDEGCSKV